MQSADQQPSAQEVGQLGKLAARAGCLAGVYPRAASPAPRRRRGTSNDLSSKSMSTIMHNRRLDLMWAF